MRLAKILTIAAAAACLSTAAMAGGFTISGAGGNWGYWSTANAGATGGAECKGVGFCATKSDSGQQNYSYLGNYSAGSNSAAGNESSAFGFGHVSAQSHSVAIGGSGAGSGFGFKKDAVTVPCGC